MLCSNTKAAGSSSTNSMTVSVLDLMREATSFAFLVRREKRVVTWYGAGILDAYIWSNIGCSPCMKGSVSSPLYDQRGSKKWKSLSIYFA